MVWIIIVILEVILDQLVKFLIMGNIALGISTPVINNFFYLTNIRNKGAAWSMLQNGRIGFLIITPIILGIMIYYFRRSDNKLLRVTLSIIMGGAIGNYIDRLLRGSVVDFLEFHFGTYRFPIFNVADSFIVIGTILLAFYLLFIYKDKDSAKEKKEAE